MLAVAATPERAQADEGSWETCEVVWWRGYRRSVFAAVALDSDGFPYDVARSPDFKWKRREAPPRETKTLAARDDLTQTLVAAGGKEIAPGEGWYGAHFRRRRVDAPPAVSDGSRRCHLSSATSAQMSPQRNLRSRRERMLAGVASGPGAGR